MQTGNAVEGVKTAVAAHSAFRGARLRTHTELSAVSFPDIWKWEGELGAGDLLV